ncbi:MAG: glycosyltransferase family 2 protein [Anaerolineales bacterium]|nr:glycosyltransferase family 2 protein [Anaerolineales bacterium]MCW5854475.1 glycosyltransferase family 2 protein [Anaerolineales bacterium]
MERTKIGALVPCYNEAQRISGVLSILLTTPGIDEVWCVDDGSTDGTAEVVRNRFPHVRLVSLPHNRGKAGAVLAGTEQMVDCDYVLLVDADLQELNPQQLQAGVSKMTAQNRIDMLIFFRTAEAWWAMAVRANDLFSGERIVRRSDLLDVLRSEEVEGYQLEVAINSYMIENKRNVERSPLYCRSVLTAEKVGWQAGMEKESKMFRSIFDYLGLTGLVRQMLWFPPLRF